jgi:predicted Zn-dependent protease
MAGQKHNLRRNIIVRFVYLLGILVVLASCSEVAITGRKQLNLIPSNTIQKMSFESYDQFLKDNTVSTDSDKVAMVQGVGVRIQKAVEKYCYENGMYDSLKGYDWQFTLIEDENVNAWAMPGGKVVVYTGLLPVARDETGLAVVMGHEIAHAIARHGNERMSQGLLVELGGMALSEALKSKPTETQNLFMKSYTVGSQYGVLLPYSRVHESEADHMGLIFMAMAGYNPEEAVGFWQRMSEASKGPKPPELLSTHPSDATRISNIRDLLPEAMRYYEQSEQM